ncbi:MAG: CATRA system-associated protein [Pseudonocardia sp.]
MTGTVVTFYSYKGGVGRTFALANTAATLCRWGYRTLCIDWDLDAPGLGFYLREWQPGVLERGLVDLIDDFARGHQPDARDYTVPISLPGARGRLDFLPAGSSGDSYVRQVQELDWAELYERYGLGEFLERCRAEWKAEYDFVLVDSRTGITDIGGICTVQLPEVLVMLFTANEQSMRGTLDVARRAVAAHDALPYDRAGLMIMPVPTRFEARVEYQRADLWRQRFAVDLRPLVSNWASRHVPIERLLGHVTIPYIPYWSFGEEVPAIVETAPGPDDISYSLESVAAVIAHRLDRTDLLAESRDSYIAAAARVGLREGDSAGYDVYLSWGPQDHELAVRIAGELTRRSLRVFMASPDVAHRETRSPVVLEAISRSRNIIILVGETSAPNQLRDVERFLRQTLDEGSDRLMIPVLAPGANVRDLPKILGHYQVERLRDADDEAITTLAHRIVRAVSAVRASITSADAADDIREDARDTLSDVTSWRLDPLRWQLVAQGIDAVKQALDSSDENALLLAAADIGLLGPVRTARLGSDPDVEAPPEVRERINELIDRLEA